MSCIGAITIKIRGQPQHVPCGKCIECLKRKRREWLHRLENEHKASKTARFLTLTYDEENIPYTSDYQACFRKKDVQNYLKKLRHHSSEQVRYFCVAEYGSKTERPHYHILMFNYVGEPDYLVTCWNLGHVHIGSITSASINYVAAYVITKTVEEYENERKPFIILSKKPAIGSGYIREYRVFHNKTRRIGGVRAFGQSTSMSRYYKERIFSKVARQSLAREAYEQAKGKEEREFREWKRDNPSSDVSRFYVMKFQKQLEEKRKVIKNLKQNRNGKSV